MLPSFWFLDQATRHPLILLTFSSKAKLEKDMNRRCSHCGHNGHNSRTCPNKGIKLFGVRLMEGALMRKSFSMGNLAHFNSQTPSSTPEHSESGAGADGYLSDGLVQTSSSARDRKKGVPWTEEEHRMFLLGLHKLGKGDWRGISRNFVTTRTPTQVASHAQKYFLRQSNLNKRKRRSSLFDLPADKVANSMFLEDPSPKACDFPLPVPELSLGVTSGHLLQSGGSSNYGMSVGIMPVLPVIPLPLTAAILSLGNSRVMSQQRGERWSAHKDDDCSAFHMATPVSPSSSVSESSFASGSVANPRPSLPFAIPLRPGLDSHGITSSVPSPAAPTVRIASATAASPATVARIDESVELPTLSLSIAPPVAVSSSLALKFEHASRHSAFNRTVPAITNGNMNPNGSLVSAISVV